MLEIIAVLMLAPAEPPKRIVTEDGREYRLQRQLDGSYRADDMMPPPQPPQRSRYSGCLNRETMKWEWPCGERESVE